MVMTPGQGRCHPGIESTALIVSGCSSNQGDPGLPALQGMLLDRTPWEPAYLQGESCVLA